MATHSSILAWEIPWTEEPGRLQSVGSQRVRHNVETEQQTKSKKNNKAVCIHTHKPTLLHSSKCLMKIFHFQIRTNYRDRFLRLEGKEGYPQI